MSATRESGYQCHYLYEDTDFSNTDALLKYFQGPYETDKKMAVVVNELESVLLEIYMKVARHKDLYVKQDMEKPYQSLLVGKTGKLPLELVENDYKELASKHPDLPRLSLFAKRLNKLEIDDNLVDVDLSSPSKKRLLSENKSHDEMGAVCSCWPL